jgi:hypothetical protein
LRSECSGGWTINLHRLFAPLFPQHPPAGTPAAQLLVHRLYREILFFMIAPLQRLGPSAGSAVWLQLVEEFAEALAYTEALFDAVLQWVEELDPQQVAAGPWDPKALAEQLAGILDSSATQPLA